MSIDLDVKLTKPVTVGAIVERSRAVLSQILNVADVPALEAWHVEQGGRLSPLPPDEFVTPDSLMVVDWVGRGRRQPGRSCRGLHAVDPPGAFYAGPKRILKHL